MVIAKDGISADLRPIRVHTVMAKPIEMDASFDEKFVTDAYNIVCVCVCV